MPVYKPIEDVNFPSQGRVIQTQQKLYLGVDTEFCPEKDFMKL